MKANNLIELSCSEINNVSGGVHLGFMRECFKEILKFTAVAIVAKPVDSLVNGCLSDESCTWSNFAAGLLDVESLQSAVNKGISYLAGIVLVAPILVYINRSWVSHQKQD